MWDSTSVSPAISEPCRVSRLFSQLYYWYLYPGRHVEDLCRQHDVLIRLAQIAAHKLATFSRLNFPGQHYLIASMAGYCQIIVTTVLVAVVAMVVVTYRGALTHSLTQRNATALTEKPSQVGQYTSFFNRHVHKFLLDQKVIHFLQIPAQPRATSSNFRTKHVQAA